MYEQKGSRSFRYFWVPSGGTRGVWDSPVPDGGAEDSVDAVGRRFGSLGKGRSQTN